MHFECARKKKGVMDKFLNHISEFIIQKIFKTENDDVPLFLKAVIRVNVPYHLRHYLSECKYVWWKIRN